MPSCSTSFSDSQQYPSGGGCGDAWVSSSTAVSSDLTVAAENDVIIAGNLTHNGSSVIGLIANGQFRPPVRSSINFYISFVPRCHGLCGSQKYTCSPVSIRSRGCSVISAP